VDVGCVRPEGPYDALVGEIEVIAEFG